MPGATAAQGTRVHMGLRDMRGFPSRGNANNLISETTRKERLIVQSFVQNRKGCSTVILMLFHLSATRSSNTCRQSP